MPDRLIQFFAGPLIAVLLCLQAVNLVHEISDSLHDSGQQCEFCLKFERTGFALGASAGQAGLLWVSQPPVRPFLALSQQLGELLSPESRGPPVDSILARH